MYNGTSDSRSNGNIGKSSKSKLKNKGSIKIKGIEIDSKARNKWIIINTITRNGGNKFTTGLIMNHCLKDKHINNINDNNKRNQHNQNQTPSLMIII